MYAYTYKYIFTNTYIHTHIYMYSMYCIYIYIYIIKRLFTLPVIVYIMKNRSDMNQIQPDCWITILWRDSGFPHRFLLLETFFLIRQKNISHRHSVSVCNRHLSAARATGLLAPVHTRLSLFIPLHLVLSDLFHCAWPETSSPHITSSLCGYNGGLWEHFPTAMPLSRDISAALLLFCWTFTLFGSLAEVLIDLVHLNAILSVLLLIVNISKYALRFQCLWWEI